MAGPMYSAALLGLMLAGLCAWFATSARQAPALRSLDIALAIPALAIAFQWLDGRLAFAALALSPLAAFTLVAVVAHGVAGLDAIQREETAVGLAQGLVIAGLWNAVVSALQLVELDGLFSCCVMVDLSGSVSGNFLQRNHLASFIAWAIAAALYLHVVGRMSARSLAGVLAILATTEGLAGSRVGLLELLALCAVGVCAARALGRVGTAESTQRARHAARMVWLALAVALIVGLARPWLGALFGEDQDNVLQRTLAGSESLRMHMWRGVLALIEHNFWLGVGWDQLGYALLSTPDVPVPVEPVQNAHNLPLHLAAVLGVPVAIITTLALAAFALRPLITVLANPRLASPTLLFAGAGLLTIGMHSMVEFPLWYHHFLVPAAVFAGLLAGASRVVCVADAMPARAAAARARLALSVLGVFVWAHAARDYLLVEGAFSPDRGTAMGPVDRASAECIWFAPQAAFAKLSTLPHDTAGEAAVHEMASQVMRVSNSSGLVVSEAAWMQSHGQSDMALRYATYLGSVFWSSKDPGRAFDSAAKKLGRPELAELADASRRAAARMKAVTLRRPVASLQP